MERERPNVRPARLDFPVVKMGPSQAQGIYLQLLDSDGNAPAATGKKDCNNELYGQATCGRRVGGTVQCNMRCACHASQARTETTHVSLCTVSGVLITSCRQSYVRQATREKRVRETIQYATCVVHRETFIGAFARVDSVYLIDMTSNQICPNVPGACVFQRACVRACKRAATSHYQKLPNKFESLATSRTYHPQQLMSQV